MSYHLHPLLSTFHRTVRVCDGSFSSGCRMKGRNIPAGNITYYCQQCDYDLCPDCYATLYDSNINCGNRSKYHPHGLVLVSSSGWVCNHCQILFNSRPTNHYRCNTCDYDECTSCFQSSKISTKLPHPHPLHFTSVNSPGWVCDGKYLPEKCISELKGKTTAQISRDSRYRCDLCDYDLCVPCYNYYMSLFVDRKHPHPLSRYNCDNGWLCNGKYSHGGCKQNIQTYGQSYGMTRYRCDACDFDLCDLCYSSLQPPPPQFHSHSHRSPNILSNNNSVLNSQPIVQPVVQPNVQPPVVVPEGQECVICMDAKRVVTFVHSATKVGHTCCCETCASQLTKCPICNLAFDLAIKNFVS